MAQQQPQSPGESPNSNDLMFIVIFFVGVLIALWLSRAYYFPFIFKIKYYELLLVNYFVPVDPSLFKQVLLAEYDPQQLTTGEFFAILNLIGNYYKYVCAIILSLFGLIIYLKSPKHKFIKTYNMSNFRKQEKTNWPQIIAASKVDLINTDIETGPWASSTNPMDFAKKNQLLDIIVNPDPNPLLGELEKTAKLREAKARQVFATQLGYIWQGPDNLPIHRKALFAIFAAISNQDRDVAQKLLREFNVSLEFNNTPKFDKKIIEELLNKHKNSKLIKQIEKRHAYVLTVMAALLELARSDGVLPCADFLWLKTMDRSLWYMLSNVGRRAAFPEVAGAVAHWRIESRMQKKLMSPMIDEAVKALKIALNEIIYQDEEN